MKKQQPEQTPDAVLVVAAILGNLGAFDELVRRYRAAVVRLAASIAGKTDAEDIAQDAFLRAFKALPSIQEPARFAPWLRAITRHCALRYRQQARVKRARTVDLDAMLLDRIGPITLPPAQEYSAALHQALDQLPDSYGLALRLYYLDEMPQHRIAAFLGVSTRRSSGACTGAGNCCARRLNAHKPMNSYGTRTRTHQAGKRAAPDGQHGHAGRVDRQRR